VAHSLREERRRARLLPSVAARRATLSREACLGGLVEKSISLDDSFWFRRMQEANI
jgi:hypothetical protein